MFFNINCDGCKILWFSRGLRNLNNVLAKNVFLKQKGIPFNYLQKTIHVFLQKFNHDIMSLLRNDRSFCLSRCCKLH